MNASPPVQDGAPFALFLSADEAFVEQLARSGRARDRGALYAIGRIVLFAPRGSPLVASEGVDGLARLINEGRVPRFDGANPEHAPYGRAVEQALRKRRIVAGAAPGAGARREHVTGGKFAATGNEGGGIMRTRSRSPLRCRTEAPTS